MSDISFEDQAGRCVIAGLIALVLVMMGFTAGWCARDCVDFKVEQRMQKEQKR